MKKKFVAIACAAALMLALPTFAWAAPSPSNTGSATGNNNVSINAKAGAGTLVVASTDKPAAGATGNIVASFDITGDATNVALTFNVGTAYAGHAFTVFIEHSSHANHTDATNETRTGVVAADGTISITVDRLSIFTVAIGDTVADSGSVDKSAKSPQTGVDFGTVAGVTAVTAIAAGAVFIALRKKVTE